MLRLLTFNTHKGFSTFNLNFTLPELRDAIRQVHADIVFLQEVIGDAPIHPGKHDGLDRESHYEFLADSVWDDYAYGKNAVTGEGHYGNAILSKFPILDSRKVDISTNRLEKRGFVYAKINYPVDQGILHCISVHLGLWRRSRKKQINMLIDFIVNEIPADEPLLVGGDFNDWTQRSTQEFRTATELVETHTEVHGREAATFPAWMPLLRLDRIYVRGFDIVDSRAFRKGVWSKLSDHTALFSVVSPKGDLSSAS